MFLRQLRWIAAGLVALAALVGNPGVSRADTLYVVQEYDTSTNTLLNSTSFTQANVPTLSTPFSGAGWNFQSISFGGTTTSGPAASDFHSLTTTLSARPTAAGFNTSIELRVTITDDGFLNSNPDGDGVLTGNLGNSSGGSVTTLTGSSTLVGSATLGPLTVNSGAGNNFAPANISGMPGAFAIQHSMILNVSSISSSNTTFGSTVSTFVSTTPNVAIPAPAGVVLALTAVPVLGLRRVLRRKTA